MVAWNKGFGLVWVGVIWFGLVCFAYEGKMGEISPRDFQMVFLSEKSKMHRGVYTVIPFM